MLETLQVDSVLSYLIALILPAFDAIFPVLPSETAVIALGVTTAGSADPRIALLVACAAAGAFLGDNLCYLLGRRFGPAVERRFFTTPKGARARAWAERSLDRYGPQLIVVCRFIPGGRTAVTLTCGLIGYPRRRFVPATAVAAVIWAVYAFLIGRIGGQAFEHNIWAGLAVAFGASVAISALIEGIRRLRRRWRGRAASGGDAGQVEPDHPGQDQRDRDELGHRDRVAEEDHADRRPQALAQLQAHREGGLELLRRQQAPPMPSRHLASGGPTVPPVMPHRRGGVVWRGWRPLQMARRAPGRNRGCFPVAIEE
jgi:membrane protein DedA with SNARE-associated domain